MELDIRDASRLLNVGEETVYRWVRQRNLPAHTVDSQYRFNRVELLEWATAEQVVASPDLCSVPSANCSSISLSDTIRAGGIHYGVEGCDTSAVLRAAIARMPLPVDVDREFMYAILMARESLGSTGIGGGIAIPHVRNPIVLRVKMPLITLCFLEHAIDFDAIDGEPVRTLFTLVSPTVAIHLRLLSHLTYALSQPALRALIRSQAAPEVILAEAARVDAAIAQRKPHHREGARS